jgi:hypothetical protein
MLLAHLADLAALRAFCKAGSKIEINNEMIEMTTNSSMRVNADAWEDVRGNIRNSLVRVINQVQQIAKTNVGPIGPTPIQPSSAC